MSLVSGTLRSRSLSCLLPGTQHQQQICSLCCMQQKSQLQSRRPFYSNLFNVRKTERKFHWISEIDFSTSVNNFNGKDAGPERRSRVHRVRLFNHLPQSKPPWRVLFFGTDLFSLKMLKTLNDNRLQGGSDRLVDTLDVVAINKTDFEIPVRQYARHQGLRILDWQPPLHPLSYDVGVLVSFGVLIPAKIIDMFPYGILNVHPSLLPRWRGASPLEHTILHGDTQTGISIMEIRPKHFDIGSILLQKQYDVPDKVTTLDLRNFMAERGSEVMMEALCKSTGAREAGRGKE